MSNKSLRIIQSTLAAAFGVLTKLNREHDFPEGNAGTFIAAGIIFTVLFITTVMTVVQLVTA